MSSWVSIEELPTAEEIVAVVDWLNNSAPSEVEYTSMSEPPTPESMTWPYIMVYESEVYGRAKVVRSWLSRGTYIDNIYVEQL